MNNYLLLDITNSIGSSFIKIIGDADVPISS